MLLRRQVLSFPFPTHLAPSHKVLFTYLLLTDAPLLTEKKIQFTLQSRTNDCNLIFLSGWVFFHFSELCTPVVVRCFQDLDWVCVCGKSEGTGASLAFMSGYWQHHDTAWLSVLFCSLPFLTVGFLGGAVFVTCCYESLGVLVGISL